MLDKSFTPRFIDKENNIYVDIDDNKKVFIYDKNDRTYHKVKLYKNRSGEYFKYKDKLFFTRKLAVLTLEGAVNYEQ